MKKQFSFILLIIGLYLSSCAPTTPPMSIHWEMGENDVQPGVCELYYTITNLSDQPITNEE